jgi:septal ring factor EnvC (AmiA/AmiB activator)
VSEKQCEVCVAVCDVTDDYIARKKMIEYLESELAKSKAARDATYDKAHAKVAALQSELLGARLLCEDRGVAIDNAATRIKSLQDSLSAVGSDRDGCRLVIAEKQSRIIGLQKQVTEQAATIEKLMHSPWTTQQVQPNRPRMVKVTPHESDLVTCFFEPDCVELIY